MPDLTLSDIAPHCEVDGTGRALKAALLLLGRHILTAVGHALHWAAPRAAAGHVLQIIRAKPI
jgi:hypothetical protein